MLKRNAVFASFACSAARAASSSFRLSSLVSAAAVRAFASECRAVFNSLSITRRITRKIAPADPAASHRLDFTKSFIVTLRRVLSYADKAPVNVADGTERSVLFKIDRKFSKCVSQSLSFRNRRTHARPGVRRHSKNSQCQQLGLCGALVKRLMVANTDAPDGFNHEVEI